MDVERIFLVLRFLVPICMFGATFLLLSAFTDFHWAINMIFAIAAGLLDVFVLAPLAGAAIKSPPEDL